MFSYLAYGLNIQSDLPLPELTEPDSATVDVTIRLGHVNHAPDTSKPLSCTLINSTTILLWSKDAGKFAIRGGRQIVVDPCDGIDESALRLFVLGPALALLLYQRGYLVLHASAVSIGGSAVAFLGQSGRGKSTTAAALHRAGHTLVADDELAVQVFQNGAPVVVPSFPQLKLWPEAINALGESPDELRQVHFGFDKRARPLERGYSSSPIQLKRIYVLGDGETLGIEPFPPQEALLQLVRHTYGTRFIHSSRDRNHLSKCVSLIRHVSVVGLKRPRSLTELPALVSAIEQDVLSYEGR